MSRMPKKKSRLIVVDGIKYRWMIKGRNRYGGRSPGVLSIYIQEDALKSGQTVVCTATSDDADIAEEETGYCNTRISPSDISLIIKTALSKGWTPQEGSGSFDVGSIKLSQYAVLNS